MKLSGQLRADRIGCALLLFSAQGVGQAGKFVDAQVLTPDGGGEAAVRQELRKLRLVPIAESGCQGVEQGLAPHGKGGPDGAEEHPLVVDGRRRLGADVQPCLLYTSDAADD